TAPPRVEADEVIPMEPEHASATEAGLATGGLVGGLGGLLIGLGALTIPGLGPVLAAGPLAAALGGAAMGAAAGGLIGTLAEMGVPEDAASAYAAELEQGRVLLTVRTDTALQAKVREVLREAGATNL